MITNILEFSFRGIGGSRSDKTDEVELLTDQERVAKEAHAESVQSMGGSKVSAIVGMPVKVQDGASAAIAALRDGKINTVLLLLNEETEVLETAEECDSNWEGIAAKLTRKDPRFVVHNFGHEREGKEVQVPVFVYYCPSGAKPRQKMFYSSCKNVIAQILTQQGITLAKNLEFSEAGDITTQAILDELYPREVAKQGFAKPAAAAGRRAARGMIGGVKFNNPGSPGSAGSPSSPQSPAD